MIFSEGAFWAEDKISFFMKSFSLYKDKPGEDVSEMLLYGSNPG